MAVGHGAFLFGRAEETLSSATKLCRQNRDWPNVYYLSGFAVEHALWGIRCHREQLDEADFQNLPSHQIASIAAHAGLSVEIEARAKASRAFRNNWKVVRDWSSNRRFKKVSRVDAKDMHFAVANATQGVMPCLRSLFQTLP